MTTNLSKLYKQISDYNKELQAREKYLSSIVDSISDSTTEDELNGFILARKQNQKWFIFHETFVDGKRVRQSIKEDNPVVKNLIKIEYAKKELRVTRANLRATSLFLKYFVKKNEYDIADEFNEYKSSLCTEVCRPRRAIERTFLAAQTVSPFHPENQVFKTLRGESVRSKSESMIADALFNHGLTYVYEYPLKLKNGRVRLVDFAILDRETMTLIYWEHLGMLGDEKYTADAIRKIQQYAEEGIHPGNRFVLTHETSAVPLTSAYIEEVIQNYFG